MSRLLVQRLSKESVRRAHSNSAVSTDDGNRNSRRLRKVANLICNKRRCANDIQSGDTKYPKRNSIAVQAESLCDNHLLGSKTPCCLKTSATIGTVELTGLEITRTNAFGAFFAMPVARSRTIPALILNRSSLEQQL